MGRRNYGRPAGRNGGSGELRSGTFAGGLKSTCPRHAVDVALVEAVLREADRKLQFARASGTLGKWINDPRIRIRNFAKDLARDLHFGGAFGTLSEGQRAAMLRCLPEDQVEKYKATPEPSVPEGLRYLPKKPPVRKTPVE